MNARREHRRPCGWERQRRRSRRWRQPPASDASAPARPRRCSPPSPLHSGHPVWTWPPCNRSSWGSTAPALAPVSRVDGTTRARLTTAATPLPPREPNAGGGGWSHLRGMSNDPRPAVGTPSPRLTRFSRRIAACRLTRSPWADSGEPNEGGANGGLEIDFNADIPVCATCAMPP